MKIDNLTSTDFNEHFAESGKFVLRFSDQNIARVVTRLDDPGSFNMMLLTSLAISYNVPK